MRSDYKIEGDTVRIEIQVEKVVAEALERMEKFSKHSKSELTNTALKRFISQHKDFLPREENAR